MLSMGFFNQALADFRSTGAGIIICTVSCHTNYFVVTSYRLIQQESQYADEVD